METRQKQVERMRREAAEMGVPLTDWSSEGEPMNLVFFDPRFPDEAQYGRVAVSGAERVRNNRLTAQNLAAAQKAVAKSDLSARIWFFLLLGGGLILILWGMLEDWFHIPGVVAIPVAILVALFLVFKVL